MMSGSKITIKAMMYIIGNTSLLPQTAGKKEEPTAHRYTESSLHLKHHIRLSGMLSNPRRIKKEGKKIPLLRCIL